MYDLIVVGGGPGGYHAALKARKAGLSTALIEKSSIGGVCLNEGCVPSKTLLNSSKKIKKITGVALSDEGERVLNLDELMVRKNKIISTLTNSIKSSLKKSGVTIFEGEATLDEKDDNGFSVLVEGQSLSAKNIIIATGSTPIIPKIDGVEKSIVVTSSELLSTDTIPKSLVVVGGGVIGLEMATFFAESGSDVTVVEYAPQIATGFDIDCVKILSSSLKKLGVKVLTSTEVIKIEDGGVVAKNSKGELNIPAEKVLVSVGRAPNTASLEMSNYGLTLESGAIKTDDSCKTSVSGVYAIGDVNGRSLLAHTAYREADVAIDSIVGKSSIVNYQTIPSVIYTHPEVASVGLTAEKAKDMGLEVIEKKRPFGSNGRFLAETDRERGVCKVVIEEGTGTILGVHLAGLYSSEIISAAAILVQLKINADQVEELVLPHPTVAEIIKETILED
jgi:dihydrolipoamide dehydrogenase